MRVPKRFCCYPRSAMLGCLLLGALVSGHGGAAVVADKTDPLYRSKGDQKRSYLFPGTGAKVTYRIYVPRSWQHGKSLPLVVVLHGGNQDENAPFDKPPSNLQGILVEQAEKHGFVVAAPSGYDRDARWGASLGYGIGPHSTPPPEIPPEKMARINPLAEQDVLNVIELMTQEYGIDRSRMFIMGNSRGSIGTLYLVEKHPELWLAMAPSDGPFGASDSYPYERLRIKGAVFVHGEQDLMAPLELNRKIAQHVIEQGITTEFIEVPGGVHGSSWFMALPQTFDFLASFPRSFPPAVPWHPSTLPPPSEPVPATAAP